MTLINIQLIVPRGQYEREPVQTAGRHPLLTIFSSSPDSLPSARVNPYPLPSVQSPQAHLYPSHPRITLETPTKELIAYLFSPPDPRFVHKFYFFELMSKIPFILVRVHQMLAWRNLEQLALAQKHTQNGESWLISCNLRALGMSKRFCSIRLRCRVRAPSRPIRASSDESKRRYHGVLTLPTALRLTS